MADELDFDGVVRSLNDALTGLAPLRSLQGWIQDAPTLLGAGALALSVGAALNLAPGLEIG